MTMLERIARAIGLAIKQRPFGLYDYSSYPGDAPPHVVRDERTGKVVFRSEDADSAEAEYLRQNEEFVARAAVEAMRPASQAVLDAGPSEPYMDQHVWSAMVTAILEEERGC